MATPITVTQPVRTWGGSLSPASFDDIAVGCTSVAWTSGALVVTFSGTLTSDQVLRVRIRCLSIDSAEEALLVSAAQAYYANQNYLALPTHTSAEAIAQVQVLTEQVNGIMKFVTRL